MSGPLAGVRVVEFAGIGPGPHCAMLLADLGAEVLRIARPGDKNWPNPIVDRGRHVLTFDLRNDAQRAQCLAALDRADVLIEGFRPGVMERLGLGPDVLLAGNPRLVYGRMTGWGQGGPMATVAGHDINYIAVTGALAAITGGGDHPVPPLNLLGDYGGGSLFLALGIVSALLERERSGRGQVVDAAVVDGVASLMAMFAGFAHAGRISLDPSRNILAGAAPFYRCYVCADGNYVAIGALEPQFYAELLRRLGAPEELLAQRADPAQWPVQVRTLAQIFATKSRLEWCNVLEGCDACFAPVLTYEESLQHLHLRARDTYISAAGLMQSAPAPRFSRTPAAIAPSGSGHELLDRWRRADEIPTTE